MKKKTLLDIQNLNITISGRRVVDGVSFSVQEGEVLCLVGESGSGKSLSALSVMGLLPDAADVAADTFDFAGHHPLDMSEKQLTTIRGSQVAMIFQEPMTSLNPVMRVGAQVEEVFQVHTDLSKKEIKAEVLKLFKKVKIKDPERRYNDYPFQLSGGQRQRVMIAMALAMKPKLLIADEPTTALDVTVQGEILKLMKELQREFGTAILFITHDFGVVQEMADRVCVMQHGKVVEQGEVDQVIHHAKALYTRQLLEACPKLDTRRKNTKTIQDDFLRVENLTKSFAIKSGGFFSKTEPFKALDNISFSMKKGETVGIVGESGCGKSTLSRCLVRLYDVDGGNIHFNGENIATLDGKELKEIRRNMQMIFQDPFASLNPRMRVGEIVSEGLKAHNIMTKAERKAYVMELLNDCGLDGDAYDRFPHQFSGGQRQRIGIARALALKPALIIADEPVSALDVSIQKQILDLMDSLKKKYNLSYLFISHDLRVISQVSDRVIVMDAGQIVETGTVQDIFTSPQHAYTKKLLSAIPAA